MQSAISYRLCTGGDLPPCSLAHVGDFKKETIINEFNMVATKPFIREINEHKELILPQENKVILNTAERACVLSESERALFAYYR